MFFTFLLSVLEAISNRVSRSSVAKNQIIVSTNTSAVDTNIKLQNLYIQIHFGIKYPSIRYIIHSSYTSIHHLLPQWNYIQITRLQLLNQYLNPFASLLQQNCVFLHLHFHSFLNWKSISVIAIFHSNKKYQQNLHFLQFIEIFSLYITPKIQKLFSYYDQPSTNCRQNLSP